MSDPQVDTWAAQRILDVAQREFGNSLKVGPSKPLGSLGFDLTLRGILTLLRWAVATRLQQKRGAYGLLADASRTPGKIWVYRWHKATLADLVAHHRASLAAYGCPGGDLTAVVEWIRATPVPPRTPAFDAIADFYGDKLSPGRLDVVTHVSPQALLDAYRFFAGQPDPAQIYFDIAKQMRGNRA